MKWKNVTKVFTAGLMAVLFSGLVTTNVYAEGIKETEPNDTKDMATPIAANKQTAADFAGGTSVRKNYVSGSTSKTDPDWFKVYLSAGEQYLTCYECVFNFTIEDENGNVLLSDMYMHIGTGPTAYKVDIPTAGNYYVKILGGISSSQNYTFEIGNPSYAFSQCKIPCEEGIINMTYEEKVKIANFNGEIQSLPKDAIAYSLKLSGIKGSLINGARLVNKRNGTNFPLNRYMLDKDHLESMNMPVKSVWIAELEYYRPTSFTPVLEVRYVYPVYSRFIK